MCDYVVDVSNQQQTQQISHKQKHQRITTPSHMPEDTAETPTNTLPLII